MRPSHGILLPGAKKSINVVLQSDQQANIALTKDKFLVMCMELEAALADATEAEIAEIWKVCVFFLSFMIVLLKIIIQKFKLI